MIGVFRNVGGNAHIVMNAQDQLEGDGCIFDKDYQKQVEYVMNKANYTFRCPHCKKMNLPDAEYCGYCSRAIGNQTIERIRKRKMDFVMIGMETDFGILDDCFRIVVKKMLQNEPLMMGYPIAQKQEKDAGVSEISVQKPRKRGRKPKNG